MNSKKVSMKEKLCYAIGSGGGNIITCMVGYYMSAYYTDSVGIAAAAVGTMLLLVRIFDGVTDVIMGSIIDKTSTKWGKARPWLFLSGFLCTIGMAITFAVPQSLTGNAQMVYAYLTYIFLNCIAYTALMVSHTSMMSRITLDNHERSVMSSMNQIANQFGSILVTVLTVRMVAASSWRLTALFFGVIAGVTIIISAIGTKEHIGEDAGTGEVHVEKVDLGKALPAMLKNKYFWLLALVFVLLLIMNIANGSSTYYFCNIVLENANLMAPLTVAGVIPAIIVNFFVTPLTDRFGVQKTMILGTVVAMAGFILMGIAGTNYTLIMIGYILKGLGCGPIFTCGFALAAAVVDFGEWKFGIRSEGLINSCVSFGQKVGNGLGAATASWILAFGGYVGTAEVQSASAISAIRFAFSYYGGILCVALLVVCLLFDIDKYMETVHKDLEAKAAAK